MTLVVVPYREGKSRLSDSRRVRHRVSLAMLGDVLSACVAVGDTVVVTDDEDGRGAAEEIGASVAEDPGDGQGAAVAAALAGREPGPVLVVNADVPCVVPHDLRSLLAATPAGGIALVEALDGTTNALSISAPQQFESLYGVDSAERFRGRAEALGVDCVSVALPNVADDVDTIDDLRRLHLRLGPRSQAALASMPVEAPR